MIMLVILKDFDKNDIIGIFSFGIFYLLLFVKIFNRYNNFLFIY